MKKKSIWTGVKQIGKLAFLFRGGAFLFLSFLIIFYHYESNLSIKIPEVFSIVLLVVAPPLFFSEFIFFKQKKTLHINHSIYDLVIVGWAIGALHLSVLPSFFCALAAATNYIALMGFRKTYKLLLLPFFTLLSLATIGFEVKFEYSKTVEVLMLIYASIHFITLSFLSFYFADKYVKGNKLLQEQQNEINQQHQEIVSQADELKQLNDSLKTLNNSLEKVVEERTQELIIKNKTLEQYAFMNSHKLRGPLARILGLTNLHQYPTISEGEKEVILHKLGESAKELDLIVSDINSKLEKEHGGSKV